MVTDEAILRTVVGIMFLIFAARIFASLGARFRLPEVVGEVLAGIIFGPYALGGVIPLAGEPLVQLNEITTAFAMIGGIVVLFAAGLEFTFADFVGAGMQSFMVGSMGVLIPMLMVLVTYSLLQLPLESALLVGATLAATSIAITVRTLEDLGLIHTEEAKITVNAAIVDDVLALATLGIVTSIAVGGTITMTDIALKTVEALILWLVLLLASVYALPRFIDLQILWRAKGAVEAASVAICFGLAFAATIMGLSPIVGAFAAGMAIAGSKALVRIKEHSEKLKIIFGPLFFAIIGSQFNPVAILEIDYALFIVLFGVAILSKVLGCGLPSMVFLKNPDRGLRVGVGMAMRGEVTFIIAGLALSSGLLQSETYAALITIAILTATITPYLLEKTYTTPILTKKHLLKRIRS